MADLDAVKAVLKSLLVSSARPMTSQDLLRDFRSFEGYECPYYALGYRNFIAFLQSIPDTLTVLSNGIVKPVTSKEIAHIQQFVALQKKPKARLRRSQSYSQSFASSMPPRKFSKPPRFRSCSSTQLSYNFTPSNTIDEHFLKVRDAKNRARSERLGTDTLVSTSSQVTAADVAEEAPVSRRILVPEIESSDASSDSFYERFRDREGDKDDEDDYSPKGSKTAGNTLHRDTTKNAELDSLIQSQGSTTINETLKANLRTLIKSYPSGIWACLLPEKYQEKYKISLNWNELGYDSVVQMAHDLLDVFICKRVKSGDWMLFDASLPLPIDCNGNESRKDPVVPEIVKAKIYNIVKKFGSGIRAEQLAQLYYESYGKSLSSDAPQFDNDEMIFLSLQDTVIHLRYIRKECYIYPGLKPDVEELPVLTVDTETKKELGLYPDEVMGPGESYIPPQLPESLVVGEYIELKVAEVYNPQKFWITLREYYSQLERLMDELQDFYKDHGDKYIMPESALIEGLCCTAIYSKEWHRATIRSVAQKVEVFYVDYGTVGHVPLTELRFIHRDFSALPAQAIRGSLCGIQPSNGRQRFTREACHAFLQLVFEKPLIGVVQSVDLNEPFLELFLVDTNGDADIHLNDVLVNLKHASFKPNLLESINEPEADPNQEAQSLSIETTVIPPVSKAFSRTDSFETSSTTSVSSVYCYTSPVASTSASPPVLNKNSTSVPPPGFSGGTAVQPGLSPMNLNGLLGYGTNPMMNPALAAYSVQNTPQMSAVLLQHHLQQQQQAFLLAYYQNLLQQSTASLLAAQAKESVLSSTSLFGAPLLTQQQQLNVQPSTQSSSVFKESPSRVNNLEANYPSVSCGSNLSNEGATKTYVVSPAQRARESNSKIPVSSSSESDTSTHTVRRKKNFTKKRGEMSRKGSSSSLLSPNSSCSIRHIRDDSSSDAVEEALIVNRLEDLRWTSDSSSTSTMCVAPDIVQSTNLAGTSYACFNLQKIEGVCGKSLHLINVDQKAYMSTGELARNFTIFTTFGALVRTLKSKDCNPPYKTLTRKEGLSLFSELDAYPDETVKSFDLDRQRTGSVFGVLHLAPLTHIPTMLISLGMDRQVIKEFQKLRDSWNPSDHSSSLCQ